MKNIKTNIILTLSLLLLLVSCKKYTLEYKPEKGIAFDYQMDISTSIKQKLENREIESGSIVNIVINNKIKDVSDSLLLIESQYAYISMTVDMGTKKVFNSDDTLLKASVNNWGPLLRVLTHKPFTVVLNRQGKIRQITGFDSISIIMMNTIDEEDFAKQQLTQSVYSQFGENAFKSIFESFSTSLPIHPVRTGKSWESSDKIYGNYIMNVSNKFTLKEIKNNTAIIQSEATIKVPEIDNITETGDITGKVELNGSQTGIESIDINTGLLTNGELQQKLEGTINLLHTKKNMALEIPAEIIIKIHKSINIP